MGGGCIGPASPGNAFIHEHTQLNPSVAWLVQHELGGYPAGVRCYDTNGTEIEGTVSYPNIAALIVTFISPIAGHCYIS